MRSLDSKPELSTVQSALATAEIWTGIMLFVAGVLYHVMMLLGFQFALAGALALLPMLVFFSAILLAGAGGLMRRFPEHPVLAHVPLLLWLVVFYLAFI